MTDGMTLLIAAAFAVLILSLSGCSGWTAKRTHIEWPCAGSGCKPLFDEPVKR